MGCNASTDTGPQSSPTSYGYKVGDRVALDLERRMESQRFPGTMCTKKETDVGTIEELGTQRCSSGQLRANALNLPKVITTYKVTFAHGGNMRVELGRLRRPTAEDEASAAACLARLAPEQAAPTI